MSFRLLSFLVFLFLSAQISAQPQIGSGDPGTIIISPPELPPDLGVEARIGQPPPAPPPYWEWNSNWRPYWWYFGLQFSIFNWMKPVPDGFWQCTAFNGNLQSFSYVSWDMQYSAYGALYYCGGTNNMNAGCFIPSGYCRVR